MVEIMAVKITADNRDWLKAVSSSLAALKTLGNEVKKLNAAVADNRLGQLAAAAEKAGGAAGGAGKGIDALAQGLSGIAAISGTVVSAVAAAGNAISGVVGPMITLNARAQESKTAFANMLGSADAAEVLADRMAAFAGQTGWGIDQLTAMAQKMLALGLGGDAVIPTLTGIGNAVAGLGGGTAELERLALAMGQIKAKGTVQTEDLLPFLETGIPAAEILQQKLGLTAEQAANIGEASVNADQAIQALLDGMNERFPGMLQQQGSSFTGMLGAVRTNAALITQEIGKPVFAFANRWVQSARDASARVLALIKNGGWLDLIGQGISGDKSKQIIPDEWVDKIMEFAARIESLWGYVKEFYASVGNLLGAVFGNWTDGAKSIAPVFDGVIGVIGRLAEAVYRLSTFVVDVATVMVKAFGEIAGLVTDALAGVYTVVVQFGEDLWDTAVSMFTPVKDFFSGLFDGMVDAARGAFGGLIEAAEAGFNWLLTLVVNKTGPLGRAVKGIWEALQKLFSSEQEVRPDESWFSKYVTSTQEEARKAAARANTRLPSGRPSGVGSGSSGSRAGDKEFQDVQRLADAKYETEQARLAAEARLQQEWLERQLKELELALKNQQISIRKYWDERILLDLNMLQVEEELIRKKLQAAQARRNTSPDAIDREKAKKDVMALEGELRTVLQKQDDMIQEHNQSRKKDLEDLNKIVADAELKLAEATGGGLEERLTAMRRQYDDWIARLGKHPGVAIVVKLKGVEEARIRFEDTLRQIRQSEAQRQLAYQKADMQANQGKISGLDAEYAKYNADQAYAKELEDKIASFKNDIQPLGDGVVTPDQQNQLEQLRLQLEAIQGQLAPLDAKFRNTFQSGLTDLLAGGIDQCRNLGDAFKALGSSIVNELRKIAAQELSSQITKGLFGSGGGKGFLSSLFGFAGGGRVRGPGTGTSDSILARLSNGEWVMRAAAVQHYGPRLMDALNRMMIPRTAVPGFAAGGLVGADRSVVTNFDPVNMINLEMVNLVDHGIFDRYLETSSGKRKVINLLSDKRDSVRKVLF